MQISRRNALLSAGAAAAVAGVPLGVQASDVALLAQVARFHGLYDTWRAVWAKQCEHRARVEAMPDCPGLGSPVQTRNYLAFLEAHDAHKHYDESNRLGQQTGLLANAIFETPADTTKGALEKLKIAHIAIGNYPDDGDSGLEGYQDMDAPWMETVIADFERLAGKA